MIKIDRSFPAPESLAIEAKKKNGRYDKEDVVERLKRDFHNMQHRSRSSALFSSGRWKSVGLGKR